MKFNFSKTTSPKDSVYSQTEDPGDQNFINYLNLLRPTNPSPLYTNPPARVHNQTKQPTKIKKTK